MLMLLSNKSPYLGKLVGSQGWDEDHIGCYDIADIVGKESGTAKNSSGNRLIMAITCPGFMVTIPGSLKN